MSDAVRAQRYSRLAILLHWTIALLIVLQIVLPSRMEARTPEAFAITQLHKSVGITVLLLSLVRLAWRFLNPPPPDAPDLKRWEKGLSHATHWGFYLVMIAMPLTGWIMVSTSRVVVPTLLYGAVPWPDIPGFGGLAAGAKHTWHEAAEAAHGLIIKGAYVLLALHVAGALKHQLFPGETAVIPRMAPGARKGLGEPRLYLIAAAFAAVVAFGNLYQPPRPKTAPPPPAPVETPVAAAPVAPATPAAVSTAPAAPPSGPVRWTVLPGSTLAFETNWSGDPIRGRFDRWTADIVFSPDDLGGSKVSVSIDPASVKTGDDQRDASLPAADFFDVEQHPKATFTATRFAATGEGRFVAHGVLSLRGVSRPLDLPFRLKIDGDTATMSGVTSLDRTAFGVGQGEWQKTDQIPAAVKVSVSIRAKRK